MIKNTFVNIARQFFLCTLDKV